MTGRNKARLHFWLAVGACLTSAALIPLTPWWIPALLGGIAGFFVAGTWDTLQHRDWR